MSFHWNSVWPLAWCSARPRQAVALGRRERRLRIEAGSSAAAGDVGGTGGREVGRRPAEHQRIALSVQRPAFTRDWAGRIFEQS